MIFNRRGEEFVYDRVHYIIGDRVLGTDQSEYEGLTGTILEIRTDEDKETENETPDIYCSFDAPVYPHEIRKLEETFSELYEYPKTLDEINLDDVVMAPDMIQPIPDNKPLLSRTYVYLVREDWVINGEIGFVVSPIFTDKRSAEEYMREQFVRETEEGSIFYWKNDLDFVEESSEDYYKCWLNHSASLNHYLLYIDQTEIKTDPDFERKVFDLYKKEMVREDIKTRFEEDREYFPDISEEEITSMIKSDPFIEEVVESIEDDHFWEMYWNSIDWKVNERHERSKNHE